jgi:type IV pilus assembly protein PilV
MIKSAHPRHPPRSAWHPDIVSQRQRGALLLEASIAILVFSAGVVGIVALQAQSMRHVGEAEYRAEAILATEALIAQMWSSDPRTLAADFDSGGGGAGYAAFRRLVQRAPTGLPGATIAGNEPVVAVVPGPSAGSARVAITVYWQLPGESTRHNHLATAVVGRN